MISGISFHRWYLLAAVAIMIVAVLLVRLVWIPADRHDTAVQEVTVERGQGLSAIAEQLKSVGLIRSKYAFIAYVALTNKEEKLQAGRYHFTRAMNIPEIAYRLSEGLAESDDLKLVIPEGSNIWDIDQKIHDVGLAGVGEFARAYYIREGKLFPDTYRLKKDTPLTEIYQKFIDTYAKKSGAPDQYQLIVASILEKEAKKPEDMAMIADIIYRRLNQGMMLQIDATVGYGWCLRLSLAQNFTRDCDVTQAPINTEINRDGEYNTYLRHGLPPRPISNPGRVAIDATRNPTPNDYWYYLSTRDGSQIIYAKTGSEHLANRRKYLGL